MLLLFGQLKWFTRFRNGDFNLNDKLRSGRLFGIDNDFIYHLLNNNLRITTEDIDEKLNVDNSTAFRYLKQLGYTSKLDIWVLYILTEQNN